MPRATLFLLLASTLSGQQTASKAELLSLTDQLQVAVTSGDWKRAVELSAALKSAVTLQRNRSVSSEVNELIGSVLKWLPEDTETLVVAREPFALPGTDAPTNPANPIAAARQYTLFPLYGATSGSDEILKGRTLKLSLLAARKFGIGSDCSMALGLIGYEGCGIHALSQPLDESALQAGTTILGYPVREVKAKDPNRDTAEDTYLLTMVKSDVLIACNHRGFMTELLSRIDRPSSSMAFPPSLPEWKQVNRSKPFWALRHFRAERETEDPSYPGSSLLGGMRIAQPVGVAMEIDEAGGIISARYISGSKVDPWKEIAAAPDFQGQAKTRQLSPDVWEISVPSQRETGMFGIFALMGILGFVILL